MPRNDEPSSSSLGTSAPKKPRYTRYRGAGSLAAEKKEKRRMDTKLKNQMKDTAFILSLILATPAILYHDVCKEVRPLLQEIARRSFDLNLNSVAIEVENNQASTMTSSGTQRPPPRSTKYQLSSGFIKQLHANPKMDHKAVTLHIITTERKKKLKNNFASAGMYQTHVRLNLCDGENKMLAVVATNVKVAPGQSLLSTPLLAPGHVLKI